VYAKLGIKSRKELSAASLHLGTPPAAPARRVGTPSGA
jgi:hypothetical protein